MRILSCRLPPSNRCQLNKSVPRSQCGVGSAAKEAGLYWVVREAGNPCRDGSSWWRSGLGEVTDRGASVPKVALLRTRAS